MKRLYLAAIAVAALTVAPARANEPEQKTETQRERFAHCAHETKGMKPEEHRKFMSECLKSQEHPTHVREAHQRATGEASQQSKMKTCNDEAHAKSLHGDERRAFMSSCLKG